MGEKGRGGWVPQIAVASQLYDLDPAFASCTVNFEQGRDPPTALTAQASLLTPDPPTPTATTTVDAEPASSPTSGPKETGQTTAFNPIPQSTMDPGPPANDPHTTPSPGSPSGDPPNGSPSNDDPSNGNPSDGDPSNGDPSDNDPSNDNPSSGNPPSSDPSNNDPSNGNPSSPNDPASNPNSGSSPNRDPANPQGSGNSDPTATPVSLAIPIDPSSPTITLPAQLGQTLAATSGVLVLSQKTLQPGGPPITLSGLVYSLAPAASSGDSKSATLYVVNAPSPPAGVTAGVDPAITIAGDVFSPLATGYGFVVDGSTMLPGQVVTISGTVVSLASDGHGLVVGSSTMVLAQETGAPLSGGEGVGGYIWSGLGGTADATATAGGGGGQGAIVIGAGSRVNMITWPSWLAMGVSALAWAYWSGDGV